MSSFIWKGRGGKNQKKVLHQQHSTSENSSADLTWLSTTSEDNDEHDDVPLIASSSTLFSSPAPSANSKRRSSKSNGYGGRNYVIPTQEPISPLSWMTSPTSSAMQSSSSKTIYSASSPSTSTQSKFVPSTPTTVTTSSSSGASTFRTPTRYRTPDRSLPGRANGTPPKHSYLVRRTDLPDTKHRKRSVKESINHILDFRYGDRDHQQHNSSTNNNSTSTAFSSYENSTDDDDSYSAEPVLNINVNLFSNSFAPSSSSSLDTDLSGDNNNDTSYQKQQQMPRDKKNRLPTQPGGSSLSRHRSTTEVERRRRHEQQQAGVRTPTKHRSDSSPSNTTISTGKSIVTSSNSNSPRGTTNSPRSTIPMIPSPPRSPDDNRKPRSPLLHHHVTRSSSHHAENDSVTSGLRPPSLTGNSEHKEAGNDDANDDSGTEYESMYYEAPLNDERNKPHATIRLSITTTKHKRRKSSSKSRKHGGSSHRRHHHSRDEQNGDEGPHDDDNVDLEPRPNPPPFLSPTERTSRSFDYYLDVKMDQKKSSRRRHRSSSSGRAPTRRRHQSDGSRRHVDNDDNDKGLPSPPSLPPDIVFAPKTPETTATTFAQFLPSSEATNGLEHGAMDFHTSYSSSAATPSTHSTRSCPVIPSNLRSLNIPEELKSPTTVESPPPPPKEKRRPSFLKRLRSKSRERHDDVTTAVDDDDKTTTSKDSIRSRSMSPGLFRLTRAKKPQERDDDMSEASRSSNKNVKPSFYRPSSTRSLDRSVEPLSPGKDDNTEPASSLPKPGTPKRSSSMPINRAYKAPVFENKIKTEGPVEKRKSLSLTSPLSKKKSSEGSTVEVQEASSDARIATEWLNQVKSPSLPTSLDAESRTKKATVGKNVSVESVSKQPPVKPSYSLPLNDVVAMVKSPTTSEIKDYARQKEQTTKLEKSNPRKRLSDPMKSRSPAATESAPVAALAPTPEAEESKMRKERKARHSSKHHSSPRRYRSSPEQANKHSIKKAMTTTATVASPISVAKPTAGQMEEEKKKKLPPLTTTGRGFIPRRTQSLGPTTTTSSSQQQKEEEDRARKERRAVRRERRRLRAALNLELSEHSRSSAATTTTNNNNFDESMRSCSTVDTAVTLSPGLLRGRKASIRAAYTAAASSSSTSSSSPIIQRAPTLYSPHRPTGNWKKIKCDPYGLTPIKKSIVMS